MTSDPDLEEARRALLALLIEAGDEIALARIALRQNEVDAAAARLNALAQRFGAIDARLPALIGTELWRVLHVFGSDKMGRAQEWAERLLSNAVDALPEDAPEALRLNARSNLAVLRAERRGAGASADLQRRLAEEIERERAPEVWATAQLNLGNALRMQGDHAEAADCFAAALQVFKVADYPLDWARVQVGLAAVLYASGQHADAVRTLRKAIRFFDEVAQAADWAAAQTALGLALVALGRETAGPSGVWLLLQAIASFRLTQQVYSEEEAPLLWARAHDHLARTELVLADHAATPVATPHLRSALHHAEAAMRSRTPLLGGPRTFLRDRVLQRLAQDRRSGLRET